MDYPGPQDHVAKATVISRALHILTCRYPWYSPREPSWNIILARRSLLPHVAGLPHILQKFLHFPFARLPLLGGANLWRKLYIAK